MGGEDVGGQCNGEPDQTISHECLDFISRLHLATDSAPKRFSQPRPGLAFLLGLERSLSRTKATPPAHEGRMVVRRLLLRPPATSTPSNASDLRTSSPENPHDVMEREVKSGDPDNLIEREASARVGWPTGSRRRATHFLFRI
ncbi:hypothetical protein B2J93_6174 [Marssonina coronariae]|uniref:Uncharacterized protein n=1 Tax=Diplocarpon coronariae TaxID=2795749 RepID=A0A218ZJ82_9HELO|nr:hypothetical protein B2J93_6174 [Marssonina coronariae]